MYIFARWEHGGHARCVGVILHINIGGVRTNYAAFLILHGDPLVATVRRPGMDSISRGWARLVTRRKVLSIKNTIPLMIITPPSPTPSLTPLTWSRCRTRHIAVIVSRLSSTSADTNINYGVEARHPDFLIFLMRWRILIKQSRSSIIFSSTFYK